MHLMRLILPLCISLMQLLLPSLRGCQLLTGTFLVMNQIHLGEACRIKLDEKNRFKIRQEKKDEELSLHSD